MRDITHGLLITFEGGEGAGKTTLIERLEKWLIQEKHQVLKTREPGGTQLGEMIRKSLLEHQEPLSPFAELSLFLASRAQHIFEVINPALSAGKIVLCDRFNDSSLAYQGGARGLGMQKVQQFCSFISEGLSPDLTFYLDLDPAIGLQRVAKIKKQDRIESEALHFHTKIREAFLKIAALEPDRFITIDAALSPEEVFEEVKKRMQSHV
jgi:dTMP kinase